MTYTGTISVTARSAGTHQERRYCRIVLAADVAKKAGWRIGLSVSVIRNGNTLSIFPDEKSKLSIPAVKGKTPTQAIEFAASNLRIGICEATETDIRISDGVVYVDIPTSMRHGELKKRRDRSEFIKHPPIIPVVLPFALGTTERAVTMEGLRYGKDIEPVTVGDVIRILTESGRKIQPQGPRLFKLDGVTMALPEIFAVARRAVGKERQLALIV